MTPDWQLPPGVDRGLYDYLRSREMVAGYDAAIAASPLAAADVAFCERWFPASGALVDLGCGTGRLARHFAPKGYAVTGLDLSDGMLAVARRGPGAFLTWNLVDAAPVPGAPFDYAACLFSTLGMVRGDAERWQVLRNARAMLKPGGVLVLHAHNRHYLGLRGRGFFDGNLRMPQGYGGAPLALRHFGWREILTLLKRAGFSIQEVQPLGVSGPLSWPGLLPTLRSYGYLIAARRVG